MSKKEDMSNIMTPTINGQNVKISIIDYIFSNIVVFS